MKSHPEMDFSNCDRRLTRLLRGDGDELRSAFCRMSRFAEPDPGTTSEGSCFRCEGEGGSCPDHSSKRESVIRQQAPHSLTIARGCCKR